MEYSFHYHDGFRSHMFLYVMLQGKIAVIILIDYVCSINHMKNCSETTMKHLKIIIKKHLEIIRYNQFVLKSNQYFYLLYLFNEVFFGLLPMFEYFSPNRSIIAVSSATVYFFCLVYAVNDAAEEYITLVEYFRTEIFNLKWYEWDVSCRKVYSILITYLNEPMKVDFVVVNINRALFCQILKLCIQYLISFIQPTELVDSSFCNSALYVLSLIISHYW
uniref:Odorant receptor 14 n=1 Tax=Ips typographus TaxID=55986 RepID=M3UZF5_IPSTY